MVNTKVSLCGIELDNPIIPASGTFGYGAEFAKLYDINCLGTFSFKGTTREPRFGNPTPRIAEAPGGMLNSVGLQNPGIDHVIEHELPEMRNYFHKPVMANVSGFSVEEFAEVCGRLDACEQVGWLEVNISCPNVHGGGDRARLRGRGCGRNQSHQHANGHAHRPAPPRAHPRQQDRRAVGRGRVPDRAAHGLAGVRGGGRSHRRAGRRAKRRGRN